MLDNLNLPSGPGLNTGDYFQTGFPESPEQIGGSVNCLLDEDSEEYIQLILAVSLFRQRCTDLIKMHPELAVPSEHSRFGGCSSMKHTLVLKKDAKAALKYYSPLFILAFKHCPSAIINSYDLVHGGFPSDMTSNLYSTEVILGTTY